MKYKLFQVTDAAMRDVGFRRYELISKPKKSNYHVTYEGDDASGDHPAAVLENLFRKFNLEHPADFKGYSMSVGDIVALEGKYVASDAGEITKLDDRLYYCDIVGFILLDKGWG